MGDTRVIRGKILSVDRVRWTCQVQSEFGNRIIDGVEIKPDSVNTEGGGSGAVPEVNSLVYLCYPSTDSTPFIMGGATAPRQLDEGDDNEDPNDRRMNRPVLDEGDILVASSGTSRIIVRKGGVLEIGASESAKRIYIPLQNLIREFSQSWEHESGGGRMSMKARDDDETYGPERTPAEFQLQWREFAEDEFPMVDLRMGRIQAEDNERIINATKGEIVYSFNINNRHKVWIDKQGNAQVYRQGATYESYNGPRFTRHEQSLSRLVRGTLTEEAGVRQTTVAKQDLLEVGQSREVRVAGGLTETYGSGIARVVRGAVREELGSIERVVQADVTERVLNNVEQDVAGSRTISTGLAEQRTVGRTSRTLVAGGGVSPPDAAWEVVVSNGQAVIHSSLGKNVFTVGASQSAPSCRIAQKPSGAIVLDSLGSVSVELNATGVRLKTPGGEIAVDLAGTVTLGPGPVRGNVVTTVTHPFDRITGTPILGAANVQAGGVPTPGPAALPSTFLPDPS
jgi:hypothetical protein